MASTLLSTSSVFRPALSAGQGHSVAGQVACRHQAGAPHFSTGAKDSLDTVCREQHEAACCAEGSQLHSSSAVQPWPGSDQTAVFNSQHTLDTHVPSSPAGQGLLQSCRHWRSRALLFKEPDMGSRLSRQLARCLSTLVQPDTKRSTIAVGISGGVDSAVAAMLLKEQGCVKALFPLIQLCRPSSVHTCKTSSRVLIIRQHACVRRAAPTEANRDVLSDSSSSPLCAVTAFQECGLQGHGACAGMMSLACSCATGMKQRRRATTTAALRPILLRHRACAARLAFPCMKSALYASTGHRSSQISLSR